MTRIIPLARRPTHHAEQARRNQNAALCFAGAYRGIEGDLYKIRAAAMGLRIMHTDRPNGADDKGEASFFLAQCILDLADEIEEALWPDGKEAAT